MLGKSSLVKAGQQKVEGHRPKPIDIITCVLHQIELPKKLVRKRIIEPVRVLENCELDQKCSSSKEP